MIFPGRSIGTATAEFLSEGEPAGPSDAQTIPPREAGVRSSRHHAAAPLGVPSAPRRFAPRWLYRQQDARSVGSIRAPLARAPAASGGRSGEIGVEPGRRRSLRLATRRALLSRGRPPPAAWLRRVPARDRAPRGGLARALRRLPGRPA